MTLGRGSVKLFTVGPDSQVSPCFTTHMVSPCQLVLKKTAVVVALDRACLI